MTTHIERLIRQLDDSSSPSYDTRAELIDIGPDAIPAIINDLADRAQVILYSQFWRVDAGRT
ncbi:hypothetical protein [Streptomyces microflavus]|uniref:hypothetical protein n=1 Tax=Streptomyces microflavus TaxID=1919 RepID=UPI0033B35482